MNNESICHQQQPSTLTVDTLSYKELQSLAMSLSLPGKMKVLIHSREITHLTWYISLYFQQGVLVEAIKARQNNNEEAVALILEANHQRRILRREQNLRTQQQQLLKLKNGKLKFMIQLCYTFR